MNSSMQTEETQRDEKTKLLLKMLKQLLTHASIALSDSFKVAFFFLQEQSCVNGLLNFSQMISKNSSWPIHNIALDVVHFGVLFQHIIFSFTLFTNMFSYGIDDGHRVILESISVGVDCEHDYINATYIDVRPVENTLQTFTGENDNDDFNRLIN